MWSNLQEFRRWSDAALCIGCLFLPIAGYTANSDEEAPKSFSVPSQDETRAATPGFENSPGLGLSAEVRAPYAIDEPLEDSMEDSMEDSVASNEVPQPPMGASGLLSEQAIEDKELTAEDLRSGSAARAARLDQLAPLERARYYAGEKSFQLAERAYVELIEGTRNEAELKMALTELAELYFESSQYVKAIEVLNQAFTQFRELGLDARRVYRLGEFYQAAGLYEKAIGVFYEVINAVVISGSSELEAYLPVARMAQFQIARTNYEMGDYGRAFEAFDRIDVLDLSRENREVVLYYEIIAGLKAGELKTGERLLQEFTEAFPESEYSRELTYLWAELAMMQGRTDKATELLVGIIESFDVSGIRSNREEVFWKQQAGNRLANRFYAEGEYASALRIYQGMLGLSDSPNWQLPVIYQMALCFEKLGFLDRAAESYTYLVEDFERIGEAQLDRMLLNLKESVEWRSEVLQWKQAVETTGSSLLNKERS